MRTHLSKISPRNQLCLYSSVVERALRKRTVVGSIPTGGFPCFVSKVVASWLGSGTGVMLEQ